MEFETELNGNDMNVKFSTAVNGDISFLMDVSTGMDVHFYDLNNQPIVMQSRAWNATQTLFFKNAIVGFEDTEIFASNINVFPNPSADKFMFNVEPLQGQAFHLVIYSLQGQTIFESSYTGKNTVDVSLKDYPNGIYLFVIQSDTKSYNGKIVKQ